jgi:hypothetical protein
MTSYLPYLLGVISLLAPLATAECPDASVIVYSPFKPWFKFDYGPEGGDCWSAAICTLGQADAARNQQFAATALVMGLLPIFFRDIAWPEKRVVLVSRPLPALAEVLVRALGLEPVVNGNAAGWSDEDVQRWLDWVSSSAITAASVRSQSKKQAIVVVSSVALLISYAALALVEIYSKRSALGCVYPVIALTWFLIAVAPAALHVLFEGYRRRKAKDGVNVTRASAVQGADQAWPVQFGWAIYYIIGTLVYTSIMAITPLELFVWVVVTAVTTGASKMLGLYICLMLRNPVQV